MSTEDREMSKGEIDHLVGLSSQLYSGCEECDDRIPGQDHHVKGVARAANHYIEKHGYKLLHVGQETYEWNGSPAHATVAVVGTTDGSNARARAARQKVTIQRVIVDPPTAEE
jgi:hypothetical protein